MISKAKKDKRCLIFQLTSWRPLPIATLNFSKVFLSYETGNAKPHPSAFHDVVAHFDCEPRDIIFFDDNASNVAAARAEGLRAVRVQGWSEVEREIAKI